MQNPPAPHKPVQHTSHKYFEDKLQITRDVQLSPESLDSFSKKILLIYVNEIIVILCAYSLNIYVNVTEIIVYLHY